ncbi:MAG: polysaccharide deacetylase family protein [Puniceicoccales bacterium]
MFVVYWHNVYPRSLGAWDEALPRLTTEAFTRQIEWISRHFKPLDLSDFLDREEGFDPGKRRLAITFDDGFRGVKDYALPILERAGWTGTVFVLDRTHEEGSGSPLMHSEILEILFRLTAESEYDGSPLGDEKERCDAYLKTKQILRPLNPAQRTEFCRRVGETLRVSPDSVHRFAADHPDTYAKLSPEDCQYLHDRGWTIGAHTANHPRLTALSPAGVRSEVSIGTRCQERRGKKVFAYPYGDVNEAVAQEVQALGYDAAFTTYPALLTGAENPFLAPRMSFGELWNLAMKHHRSQQSKEASH